MRPQELAVQGLGGHTERSALREAKTECPPGEDMVRFAFQKRTTLQESDAWNGRDNGGGREASGGSRGSRGDRDGALGWRCPPQEPGLWMDRGPPPETRAQEKRAEEETTVPLRQTHLTLPPRRWAPPARMP